MRWRFAMGALGVALGLFGVFRILTEVSGMDLLILFLWLVGALVVHDGILAPVVVTVGRLTGLIPPRARTFLQGGLIAAALITVVALPMIYRAHSQPPVKALLEQDFGRNLTILLAIVLAASLVLYAVRVARDFASDTNRRPPADQESSTS